MRARCCCFVVAAAAALFLPRAAPLGECRGPAAAERGSGDGSAAWRPEAAHPCSIRRVSFADLPNVFPGGLVPALHPTPLVVVAPADEKSRRRNERFRNATAPGAILDSFPPGFEVTLSSSNSFSEHRVTVPLRRYLEEIMAANGGETPVTALSNESWYLFGETYGSGTWHSSWEGMLGVCWGLASPQRNSVAAIDNRFRFSPPRPTLCHFCSASAFGQSGRRSWIFTSSRRARRAPANSWR
jgi:hypothetical protein